MDSALALCGDPTPEAGRVFCRLMDAFEPSLKTDILSGLRAAGCDVWINAPGHGHVRVGGNAATNAWLPLETHLEPRPGDVDVLLAHGMDAAVVRSVVAARDAAVFRDIVHNERLVELLVGAGDAGDADCLDCAAKAAADIGCQPLWRGGAKAFQSLWTERCTDWTHNATMARLCAATRHQGCGFLRKKYPEFGDPCIPAVFERMHASECPVGADDVLAFLETAAESELPGKVLRALFWTARRNKFSDDFRVRHMVIRCINGSCGAANPFARGLGSAARLWNLGSLPALESHALWTGLASAESVMTPQRLDAVCDAYTRIVSGAYGRWAVERTIKTVFCRYVETQRPIDVLDLCVAARCDQICSLVPRLCLDFSQNTRPELLRLVLVLNKSAGARAVVAATSGQWDDAWKRVAPCAPSKTLTEAMLENALYSDPSSACVLVSRNLLLAAASQTMPSRARVVAVLGATRVTLSICEPAVALLCRRTASPRFVNDIPRSTSPVLRRIMTETARWCASVRFRWRVALTRHFLTQRGCFAVPASDVQATLLRRAFNAVLNERAAAAATCTNTWTCPVCYEQNDARRLGCGHVLCWLCECKVHTCPLCRSAIDEASLPVYFS
jgi:hypothetical protein